MGEVDRGGGGVFILVSKGRDGRGWKSFTAELHLVIQFFRS